MMMKARLKAGINKLAAPLGVQVLPLGQSARVENLFELIDLHGLVPLTVFDIGVAEGTPWLYEAFPAAHYILVDPTRESLPYMKRLQMRLDADILNVALGDTDGRQIMLVRDKIDESTLFEEIGRSDVVARRYEVEVRRFDSVIPAFERPALCKIDVQGAETAVIRGMGERVAEIDFFIIETSTIATQASSPEFAELFKLMDERGFVVFDIVGLRRRPLDGALAQVDIVFVRADSPLRADKRWAER